jgi:YVTN family beta-propeller protein
MSNAQRFGGLSKRDPHIIEGRQGQTVENCHILDGILVPFEEQGNGYFSENDNSIIATISVGDQPGWIAILPNGTKSYVCDNLDDTVSVINNVTQAVSATLNLTGSSEFPVFILILPDGSKAYVGCFGGTELINVIDTSTDTVTSAIANSERGYHMVATSDSAYVYAVSLNYVIQKIDTSTDGIVATIIGGEEPVYAVITSDDAYIYVANALKDRWRKIGGDGVYSSWNTNYERIAAMAVYNGKLYAGSGDSSGDAEVWEYNGSLWAKIGGDGVNSSWATHYQVKSLHVLGSKLYAAVVDISSDGEVWEYNGTTWTKIGGDTLNSSWPNTTLVNNLSSFDSKVYAATSSSSDKAEVWEYNTGTTTWAKIGGGGTNSSWTTAAILDALFLVEYDSGLCVGIGGASGPAEVWSYSGSTWTQIGGPAIPDTWDSSYERAWSLAVYNSKLYVGLGDQVGDAVVYEYDGSDWTKIGGDGVYSSWPAATMSVVYSLISYNGKLYAGVGTGEAELWEYNGSAWSLYGGSVNFSWAAATYEGVYAMVVYKNALCAGLGANTTDAEVWRIFNDYSVSVIDTSDDSLYTNILGLDDTPYYAAILSDDSKVYVSNTGTNKVSVIDVATNTVTATIAVGTTPRYLVVSNDDSTVYVCNHDSSSISVINTTTDTVTKTISTLGDPWHIILSPNGKYLYVTEDGTNFMTAVDVNTNLVISTTDLGVSPSVMAITPNSLNLYITSSANDNVKVLQTFPWDSQDIDGGDLYLDESTSTYELYVISDTKLYHNNFETEVLDADGDSLELHTTGPNSFLPAFGNYYVGDASQAYVRKTNDVFRRMGLPQPDSSSCSTAENGAGNVTDANMAYAVTFVDTTTGRESVLSADIVTVVTSTTSKKITLTIAWPTGLDPDEIDPEIDKINIYRRGDATVQAYLFVAQVAHSAVTYDDNDAVPEGPEQEVEYITGTIDSGHNDIPVDSADSLKWSQFVEFGSRIFMSKPNSNLVYFTLPYPNVEYVSPANNLALPGNVVKLVPLSASVLLIFTMQGIFQLLGESPDVWDLSALSYEVPTDRAGYIVDSGNGVYALVTDGIKYLNGDHLVYLYEDELRPVFRDNFTLGNWGTTVKMSFFTYKGKLLVFWESSSVPHVLVVDVPNQIIYHRTLVATPLENLGWFTNLRQEPGLFSTSEMINFSYLSESPVGGRHAALPLLPAYSLPADMTYRTKDFDLGKRNQSKKVSYIEIAASGKFTVQIYIDGDVALLANPKIFTSTNLANHKLSIPPNKGNHFSLEFKNISDELCKIYDYGINGFPSGDTIKAQA